MRFRTRVLPALAAGAFSMLMATAVMAADIKPFETAAFEAAQKEGRPIVVDIAASWCPTCKAQKPIIQSLAADAAFDEMIVFEVDFDSQKDVVRSLDARMQSTLIAYDGSTETGRSVGDTKPDSIKALFTSALGN